MKCLKCNGIINANDLYCNNCGNKIDSETKISSLYKELSKNNKVCRTLLLIFGIVFIIVLSQLFESSYDDISDVIALIITCIIFILPILIILIVFSKKKKKIKNDLDQLKNEDNSCYEEKEKSYRKLNNNERKIYAIIFIIISIIFLFVTACSPKHKTDKDVLRYLSGKYHEEFEIISKEKSEYKGTEASCDKNVIIYVWKAKSKSNGQVIEVQEIYRMGAFTCEYDLLSNE